MLRVPAIIAVLALIGTVPAGARQSGTYEAGFERDVNRYRWTGNVGVSQQSGLWTWSLDNRFRSDAFLLFDDRLSFRDENALSVDAGRRLGSEIDLAIRGRSNWYSLSRVLTQTAMAGLTLRPVSGVVVEPMVGVAMDRRPGALQSDGIVPMRADAGPAVGLTVTVPERVTGGYTVQLDGSGGWQRLEPRRGGALRLKGAAERAFLNTVVRADVQLTSVRRDAYQAASFLNRDEALSRRAESIESTRSDTAAVALIMDAPVSSTLSLGGRVSMSANNRSIRTRRSPEGALFFDSDFRRRAADAELSLGYSRGETLIRGAVQAGAETENRVLANEDDLPGPQAAQKRDLLRQADYDRGYMTLRLNMRVPIGAGFVWQADGSANGIRHDTPIINLDDRDELFYNGRVGLLYRLSNSFDMDVQAFGSYYHTVYLKAARSAENSVQRSIRLRPSARWRISPGTRLTLVSEVRATYTVDDFVLPGRRPTDQAAREMRYDVSLEKDLPGDLLLRVDARYSDLRLGRFLDEVFAEIPYDTLMTHGGWARVQTGGRVTAEVGIRLFVRTDFDRSATVRYDRLDDAGNPLLDEDGSPLRASISRPGRQRIEQFGPTCAVIWPLKGGAFLRFDGWATIQRVSHRLYGDLPEESAEEIRWAASKGTRTLIPNLAVTMRWTF